MKCDRCDNEATVTVKTIINGEEKDFHLCNECVMKFTDLAVDDKGEIKTGIQKLDKKKNRELN